MRAHEITLFTEVDRRLSQLESRPGRSPSERQEDLATGLRLVVEASFQQDPNDYAADIAALNADPAWAMRTDHQASPTIPPKFFGGDPTRIVPGKYVLHLSLNHALTTRARHQAEYAALRDPAHHYGACAEYFRRYWHGVFFKPRATLMREYERARGRAPMNDDAELLGRSSLFVERYPTWSPKLCAPSAALPRVLCLALNERLLRFVLTHFPPEAVLVTGNPARTALNTSRPLVNGARQRWVNFRVPKRNGAIFKAGFSNIAVGSGATVPVMRCGFVPSKGGPNHSSELALVGRLLAGLTPDPAWQDGYSPD